MEKAVVNLFGWMRKAWRIFVGLSHGRYAK